MGHFVTGKHKQRKGFKIHAARICTMSQLAHSACIAGWLVALCHFLDNKVMYDLTAVKCVHVQAYPEPDCQVIFIAALARVHVH